MQVTAGLMVLLVILLSRSSRIEARADS
jgi:hypothetical protein